MGPRFSIYFTVLPAHPDVHPQLKRYQPSFAFPAIVGTYLPTSELWKAGLGGWLRSEGSHHPTANRAECRATALIESRVQRVTATLNCHVYSVAREGGAKGAEAPQLLHLWSNQYILQLTAKFHYHHHHHQSSVGW